MKRAIACFLVMAFLMPHDLSFAQIVDFAPREKIIFQDDFSEDSIGKFPSKWYPSPINKQSYEEHFGYQGYWKIGQGNLSHILTINASWLWFEPMLKEPSRLPDSFTVEFDFKFDAFGHKQPFYAAELDFQSSPNNDRSGVIRLGAGSAGDLYLSHDTVSSELLAKCMKLQMLDTWHHFAFDYCKKQLSVYIDQEFVCTTKPEYQLYHMLISCVAPVNYTNFKITTGKRTHPFGSLLTTKKLVTHAIHFDVNKATIKPESKSLLMELAAFLKINPGIKLEIDGHTDSDGDTASNRKLSQARADAIKTWLVSSGVNGQRLSTHGFGAAQPIKPNDSPANKAENRRVEFVKR